MNVRKFYGATTRDALRQVRDTLGADALILSNRQVAGGGVEIMAIAEGDVAALTNLPAGAIPPPVVAGRPDTPSTPLGRSASVSRTYAIPDDDEEGDAAQAYVMRSNRAPAAAAQQNTTQRPPAAKAQPGRLAHEGLFNRPPQALSEPARPATARPATAAPARAPETRQENARPEPVRQYAPEREPDFTFPSLAEMPSPARAPAGDPELKEEIGSIMKELKFLRTLVEGQLAGFAWNEMQGMDPTRLEIFRRMLAAGFSPALTRQLLNHMPPDSSVEAAMKWINTALLHNLTAVGLSGDIVEAGGVYALVGPTGVGKTTTVAKLAARCTLKHGPGKVALITTDSYRIGAHDQLRIYGKILGVTVYAVSDETDLQLTLADLADKHLILVDTVGMSQRDKRVEEQIALLSGKGKPVRRLLLISSIAQGSQLDDVVARYTGTGLEGVILTKVDEAMQLGASLDVIIRRRLPLHYVTNGQRVPEDLHLANPLYLIDRALRLAVGGAHLLKDDEYPAYIAAVNVDKPAAKTRAPGASGRE